MHRGVWGLAIINTFSKRQKLQRGEVPDVYTYTVLPQALRAQIVHNREDGNGRLGRMLVPLFLWQTGLIQSPMFYISGYLVARRDAYYEGLFAVSRDGDWTGWCRFFLEAVRAQAEDNLTKAKEILDLYERMKHQVAEMTRSQYAIHALDWIFERPIFKSSDFVAAAGIPAATARRFLSVLRDGGVLKPLYAGRGRRAAVLAFPALLNIAEGPGGPLTRVRSAQPALSIMSCHKVSGKHDCRQPVSSKPEGWALMPRGRSRGIAATPAAQKGSWKVPLTEEDFHRLMFKMERVRA